MDELLTGLVPGLPDDVARRLREAADGIPLYAVETVRMLRDRGLLEQADGGDVVTGDLTAFEVPETLHALIASRLDGVPEAERRLLQDASVLGKTFTRRGARRALGRPTRRDRAARDEPVRKELLTDRDRSVLARARPARLPAGARPAGHLRDDRPARPPGAPSRRGALPLLRAPASTPTRSPR